MRPVKNNAVAQYIRDAEMNVIHRKKNTGCDLSGHKRSYEYPYMTFQSQPVFLVFEVISASINNNWTMTYYFPYLFDALSLCVPYNPN